MGLLWPNFMATFGDVFGLGFAIEGFSFFVEAIFIGIYVYGWDRLSPRAHLLSGIPIVITGFTGSLMVIAVNAWMNHPDGLHARGRPGRRRASVSRRCSATRYFWHELVHMYIAGYIVTGFVRRRRLRRRAAARALGPLRAHGARDPADRSPRSPRRCRSLVGDWAARDVAETQPTKLAALEGLAQTDERRARCTSSAGTRTARSSTGSRSRRLLSLLAFHDPNATVAGPRRGARRRPAAGQRRALRLPDDGRDRHAARAARRRLRWRARAAATAARVALVLPRAWSLAGPLSVVALIAGWVTTEVGRQPWVVYRVMRTSRGGHGRRRDPGRLRDARRSSTPALAVAVAWILRRLARAPLELPSRRAPDGGRRLHDAR